VRPLDLLCNVGVVLSSFGVIRGTLISLVLGVALEHVHCLRNMLELFVEEILFDSESDSDERS
jgi:hypothetical protein